MLLVRPCIPIYLPHSVDSNDCLYAGDKKLVADLAKLVSYLINQILEHLKSLSGSDEVCMCVCLL